MLFFTKTSISYVWISLLLSMSVGKNNFQALFFYIGYESSIAKPVTDNIK